MKTTVKQKDFTMRCNDRGDRIVTQWSYDRELISNLFRAAIHSNIIVTIGCNEDGRFWIRTKYNINDIRRQGGRR
jgi:hypothetical protein